MSELEMVETLFDFIEHLIIGGLKLNEEEQECYNYLRKEWVAYMNGDYENEEECEEE